MIFVREKLLGFLQGFAPAINQNLTVRVQCSLTLLEGFIGEAKLAYLAAYQPTRLMCKAYFVIAGGLHRCSVTVNMPFFSII